MRGSSNSLRILYIPINFEAAIDTFARMYPRLLDYNYCALHMRNIIGAWAIYKGCGPIRTYAAFTDSAFIFIEIMRIHMHVVCAKL